MVPVSLFYMNRGMAVEKDPNLFSVYEQLVFTAEKYGQKEAIYDLKNRVSYSALLQAVDHFANVLAAKGVKKGDRIAVSLPNWYETAVIYFSAAKIGAILVPINPLYKSHELEYILDNAAPVLLIASESLEKNLGFQKSLKWVKEAITVRFPLMGFPSFDEYTGGAASYRPVQKAKIDADNDVFCILYTSGTTGKPKGVMITHRAVVQSARTIASGLKCTHKDAFIISAPLFHIFGLAINLVCAISAGARILLQEKFRAEQTLKLIEQESITVQQGVPTMFLKQLEVENLENYNLSSLRTGIVGASPIPPNKVKEIREKMGMELNQSFGITEAVTVTSTTFEDDEDKILETLGRPIPGVELKIVNDKRETVPHGAVGEIAVRSFAVMKGYYKMPEQTAEVLDSEGWFYTGDLGMLDEDGYLKFVGRKKEMIIRGGFNIYPQEIEAILSKHPYILESAVIGFPDEVLGEVVCAVIRLKEGADCTEEDILAYLKERIAIYKVPQRILFTQDFPTTASGKIQKVRLREQLLKTAAQNNAKSLERK
ncbi:class I adenylate-forming enzyme family protein [Heyndrickxia coagulans]|uniref:class I adenylate-forming enzyme family protein n=1 Tax=Heyndrickxia coagulans TaxID=1398 RepID=UPI0009B7683B